MLEFLKNIAYLRIVIILSEKLFVLMGYITDENLLRQHGSKIYYQLNGVVS